MIREKFLARLSGHCTYETSYTRRSIPVYRVSSSQYDWMMRIRCRTTERASCEWNLNTKSSTSCSCDSWGSGKKAFNLKDATVFDDGYANCDPCLAPHNTGSVMCAYLVAKSAIEWCHVSATYSVYPWCGHLCWYMVTIWVLVVMRSKYVSMLSLRAVLMSWRNCCVSSRNMIWLSVRSSVDLPLR